MWWMIPLGILALITLLLFLKVRLCIIYSEELSVKARILLFNIPIFPKKAKKIKPRDYSLKALEKKKAKAEKNKLKQKKKDERSVKKAPPHNENTPPQTVKEKIGDILELVTLVLKNVMSPFGRYLKIEIVKMHVKIGGSDPAKTALTYGIASQGIAYILELLSNVTNVDVKKKSSVNIYADFLSEKSDADINITLGLRVWHALSLAIKFFMAYLKNKNKKASHTDHLKTGG